MLGLFFRVYSMLLKLISKLFKKDEVIVNIIMPKFKNDDKRLKTEFEDLKSKNIQLQNLLIDLSDFISKILNKDLIITMIFRTQEEQDNIYKNDPKYKQKPFKSPHQSWTATDIRSLIFNDIEIKQIEDYLNNKYNKANYFAWTAKNHKVGEGAYHFHIQYLKR